MFENDDFGFMGFVTEVAPASENETVPNTYEKTY